MKLKFAERIEGLEEYFLAGAIKRMGNGKGSEQVISFAVGSPDLQPPHQVIRELTKGARAKHTNGYQPSIGTKLFRAKAADWYNEKFGVKLNKGSEVISLIGSKEGIFHISLAMLNKGDKILAPDPGYPIYSHCAKLLGAETISYNLLKENGWKIDINELRKKCRGNVKILWLNSPHMPTGTELTKKNIAEVIEYAKEKNILVVHDNPYNFILNKKKPFSILSIKGAKENVVEFCSLSKSFNIPGFRIAIAAGNSEAINAISRTKSIIDSGSYLPLQLGAVKAFELKDDWFDSLNSVYESRKKALLKLVASLGCRTEEKSSGLFVWAKLPAGTDDMEYTEKLFAANKILVTPGSVYGSNGKGYLRFSLCQPVEKIKMANERIVKNKMGAIC